MLLQRPESELLISEFSEEELQELKQLTTFRYREKTSTGFSTDKIQYYRLSEDEEFLSTSMGFLHGILNEFPAAESDIQPMRRLPLFMKKNYILWDEQIEIFKKWYEHYRGTISIPTGGGKSFLALSSIFHLRGPTLICVPTKEIQNNVWMTYLTEKLGIPRNYIGRFGGGYKEIKPITIAIYNSAYLYIDLLKDKFEFLIPDECHRAPSKQFKKIALQSKALYRCGLSATPTRQDHNEELIYKSIGPLIQGPKFNEMVDSKRIAPFVHERIFTNLLPYERETYDELFQKYRSAPKRKYNEFTKTRQYYMVEMQKLALGSSAKIPPLTKMVFKHMDDKILIYTKFINQAETLNKILRPYNAKLLIGKTKKHDRKRIFDWFHRSGKAIIIATNCIDEGINVPDANVAIIASGHGVVRQMIQRIGRTVRYKLLKISKIYEIVSKDTFDERQSGRRQIKE